MRNHRFVPVSALFLVQGIYVAVVFVLYFTVYRPIIAKMDVTIKRSRSMLLLFPGEVVQSVVAIRNTMAAYAKGINTTTL
jgi:hypothetical protein